ncbi:MAG: hypothetical protein PUB86_07295 [Elusimicrobia bacterium]|nr:hypothetical protein [Elusimicrobiota bacterium]
MDITANKRDKIYRPDSVYTLNAGEMNQIISEIMTAITSAGITPSSADTGQLREAILASISGHNTDGEAHADIRQAIEALQLLKLVDVLPAQGESKYIYAVPQDERTTDGQLIVVLFIWTGTEWAAVGALTTSVDLTDYLKKTDAQNTYLPKTGGNLTGQVSTDSYIYFRQNAKGLIFPGSAQITGFDTGNLFIQNANNGLIFRKSDNQLVRRRNNVDSILLSEAEKGVSGGVASLGTDGKVPQEQLPNISAATPAVDLGQVSEASFEVNKNYGASVSGSASFTLPTPADSTIANKITLSLNVLANSVISWGTNVNAALAEFTPGKYQIRLLWNNTSSAWSAEVLKETKTESNVKTFVSFNGNYSDECGTVSLTLNNSPSYVQGPFENYQSLGVDRANSPLTMSGDLTKWNFGLNPFKITCWVLNSSDVYFDIFSSSDNSTKVNTMGQCTANGVTLSPTTTSFSISSWTFLEFGRGSDGIFRFFVNGVQKMQKDASTVEADFSNASRMFSGYGSASTAYMSDFVISAESVSQANYTRPTTPFVLSDSGVSDLHDIKIAELYSSISALQNELQILKGQSMKRLDYTNAVEFYLKEKDQTSYTVPANGYIFGYGYQTYKTVGESYTGNILINGINVGKYFRKYTLNNDQVDTSIPLSMPLPVSAGDVITITDNREAFQEPYLFVPEKED